MEEGGKRVTNSLGATGFVVSSQTKYPDQVFEVFEWYMAGSPGKERAETGWGIPPLESLQSLLPYDKDTIKEAIKVELNYAGTAEPRDEKMFLTIQLSFLQLASFLPDDEVVADFEVDEALESDDVCHNYFKYLDRSEKVSNHILEQTSVLVDELDKFCQDNGLK